MSMTSCFDDYEVNISKSCDDKQIMYFKKCIQLAQHSNLTHKHGCVIVLNDRVIGVGHNYKENNLTNGCSVHAEICAMKSVKKNLLSKCELYVVRLGPMLTIKETEASNSHICHDEDTFNTPAFIKRSCLKYSRPCARCASFIQKFNIKKVYYSLNAYDT